MVEINAQLRQWGRSVGVVIPKKDAVKAHLKAGKKVKILIMDKKNPLKETFNSLKIRRTTKEILDEVDREGWNE